MVTTPADLMKSRPQAGRRFVAESTAPPPLITDQINLRHFYCRFFVASLPCALLGLWHAGNTLADPTSSAYLHLQAYFATSETLGLLPIRSDGLTMVLLIGAMRLVPVTAAALIAGWATDALIARIRHRRVEPGLLPALWLFALMTPVGMGLPAIASGAVFGVLVGRTAFGGLGQSVVHPAIAGIVFLILSYPGNFVPPNDAGLTTLFTGWESDSNWLQTALLGMPGIIGVGSASLVLLGGLYLVTTRTIDWRLPAGAVIGLIVAVSAYDAVAPNNAQISWPWHLVVGAFLFSVFFLAADPVTAGLMRATRWVSGLLIGFITAAVRIADPTHPEGVYFAAMLTALFTPAIDHAFIALANYRRRQRQRRLIEVWNAWHAD